ncbi:hypothetical protein IQ249_15125 [Lusitaniella coriacea LEGE 07157]|uniref:Uncharacterized protein n=1 Tax=Lusitaniella coriacea LEGE 07157 TaxID=945747 RepID=A0A8J7DXN5_9CYAN|nr:hypothetical protein [Lusitaniella coriacea]MBE9117231.1 hypothetical protein [Lusitaniella coriacea LEGE 07157]
MDESPVASVAIATAVIAQRNFERLRAERVEEIASQEREQNQALQERL